MRLETRAGRRRATRGGVAATELALLLPFLVFLFLISVDFARFAHAYITVTNCARNGAIYASSNATSRQQSPYYNANINTATQTAARADASSLSSLPTVADPQYNTNSNPTQP